MGNLISSGAVVGASGGGKVVMADGSVRALSEPVSVAELMMDHPRHFVIDARDLQQQRRRQRRHKGKAGALLLQGQGRAAAGRPRAGRRRVYVLLPATTRGKVSAEEARCADGVPVARAVAVNAGPAEEEAVVQEDDPGG